MSGNPIAIIGIGHDGPHGLSPAALAHIAQAQVLAGGKRHLAFFPDWQGEKVVIDADLSHVVECLKVAYRQHKTVVLASGDPLFYGIGRLLLEAFPKDDLLFLPHVSSVQLAFARIKESWHDACVVSLHGRPIQALLPALQRRAAKIAVLTDAHNHPAAIAHFLSAHGLADYTLWVCEELGGPGERITCWTPESIQEQMFSPLNVTVLLRQGSVPPLPAGRAAPCADTVAPEGRGEGLQNSPKAWGPLTLALSQREREQEPSAFTPETLPLLGLPEEAIAHRQGMITKRELRLLALCYLALRPGDVLWDIGAGSGSVSVEAARLSASLQVFALERSAPALAHIEYNVAQFALTNVHPVLGEAPEALALLPNPDAVFIGGSGGRLADMIPAVLQRLRPGGRLVMHCITLENFLTGWELLKRQQALPVDTTTVQLSHAKPLGPWHRLESESPSFILRAIKL